ncbi:MAG: MatK/TrnK amino terminal region [Bacteriophage sp.]|nr:MAG: MatK/TrnK amino terminal region [Bacteriophage sp.]
MSYFDHWLKEDKAVKYYFRYADDMVILHSDKEYLRQLLDEIREQLGTLKLEIKSNYQIFKVEDRSISFVGYKIYHDYTLIRKNIKHKMCKKVAAMNKLKHTTYSEYRQQVCSHIGWMKHCNGINLLKKIIKYH